MGSVILFSPDLIPPCDTVPVSSCPTHGCVSNNGLKGLHGVVDRYKSNGQMVMQYNMHTYKYVLTTTRLLKHTYASMHAGTRRRARAHTHTHAHTYTHTYTHTHTHTHTLSLSLSLSHTHAPTHPPQISASSNGRHRAPWFGVASLEGVQM